MTHEERIKIRRYYYRPKLKEFKKTLISRGVDKRSKLFKQLTHEKRMELYTSFENIPEDSEYYKGMADYVLNRPTKTKKVNKPTLKKEIETIVFGNGNLTEAYKRWINILRDFMFEDYGIETVRIDNIETKREEWLMNFLLQYSILRVV